MTRFLQRYSANRCTFTFQKEKNCFHFTQSLPTPHPPLHPPPPRGDFYFLKKKKGGGVGGGWWISSLKKKKCVFQSLSWSEFVAEWCHISIFFLGPSAETSSGNISGTNWCLWRQWALVQTARCSERLDVTYYPGTEFHCFTFLELQFNEIYSKILFYSKYLSI